MKKLDLMCIITRDPMKAHISGNLRDTHSCSMSKAHKEATSPRDPHDYHVLSASFFQRVLNCFSIRGILQGAGRHRQPIDANLDPTDLTNDMPSPVVSKPISSQCPTKTKQPYEAFLILDVEATCHPGTDFNFPNEIIVCTKIISLYTCSE